LKAKKSSLKFGEDVEGYNLPVLNEREIRAAAGMMFLVLIIALGMILFKRDFLLVKYVIVIFLCEFIARVFISPRFAPLLVLGRLIVSRQNPEYTGAPQKKFAWKIGLALSSLMFFLMVVLNSYSIITGITCLFCLVFLFFESSFGICLGCIVYKLFYKNQPLICAGESCEIKPKQAIRKTSSTQFIWLLAFVLFIVLLSLAFNEYFQKAPKNLFEILGIQ